MNYVQELSAVTAACMMTRKDIYNEVCGLDEKFEVAFNDIDYCMKLREKGLGIIFTPLFKAVSLRIYKQRIRNNRSERKKISSVKLKGLKINGEKNWKKGICIL